MTSVVVRHSPKREEVFVVSDRDGEQLWLTREELQKVVDVGQELLAPEAVALESEQPVGPQAGNDLPRAGQPPFATVRSVSGWQDTNCVTVSLLLEGKTVRFTLDVPGIDFLVSALPDLRDRMRRRREKASDSVPSSSLKVESKGHDV